MKNEYNIATAYASPESPLSKMDVFSCTSSDQPSSDGGEAISPLPMGNQHFDLPAPERLLPIGPHSGTDFNDLVDKVRTALNVSPLDPKYKTSMSGKQDDLTRQSSGEGSSRYKNICIINNYN